MVFIATYTKYRIEEIVHDLFRRRPDVPREPPIDVELILETTPNVVLEIVPNLARDIRIEACVCRQFMHRERRILVDAEIADSKPRAEYRFVLAEELAHVFLHDASIAEIHLPEDAVELLRHPDWWRMEFDAREFASRLLIPTAALLPATDAYYVHVVNDLGFDDHHRVLQGVAQLLAGKFDVPIARTLSRLSSQGLDERIEFSTIVRASELVIVIPTSDAWMPGLETKKAANG